MNAVKHWVDLDTAASICYPKGWRLPPTNEIDQQRALEAKEDARREYDSYTAEGE